MDLLDCIDVSEQAIIQEIYERYQHQEIYSAIGSILLAVNPHEEIPSLYSQQLLVKMVNLQSSYGLNGTLPIAMANASSSAGPARRLSLSHALSRSSQASKESISINSPHVWKVAREAFLQLWFDRVPQAIVISGESGAGKTEATKKCLQLLSTIAATYGGKSDGALLEEKVLAVSPVLESFGNAKTGRNHNSSRFGKWIQLNYSMDTTLSFRLSEAVITQYLLEKSRVVIHSSEERSYHIFYQLCACEVMGLRSAPNYRYLRNGRSTKVENIDDEAEFEITLTSMNELGFTELDRLTIFGSLKSILLLGNLVFEEQVFGSSANRAAIISEQYQPLLTQIAEIIGIPVQELSANLLSRSLTVRGETAHIAFDAMQAQNATNAVAKEIYGRLFNFIVYQANRSLQSEQENVSSLTDAKSALSIGILDIFGFEKFEFNSFEQLCINYANEKLHQYFLSFVVKKEQEIYLEEGIEHSWIAPADNIDLLQLLDSKKTGLFAKLDDEVKFPKGSDESFIMKVEAEFNRHKPSTGIRRFMKDVKMPANQFEIHHFAGVIRYDCTGFIEKNRDKLFEHLHAMLQSSRNERFKQFMSTDWDQLRTTKVDQQQDLTKASNAANTMTLIARFQSQLQSLVDVLNTSQPHFIKCIKPNEQKKPKQFDRSLVLEQLRYSGVLEAIQVRKSGYPNRRSLEHFWRSFWSVPQNSLTLQQLKFLDERRKCEEIVNRLKLSSSAFEDIKIGKAIVFLRPHVLVALEQARSVKIMKSILYAQCLARRISSRRIYFQRYKSRCAVALAVSKGKQDNECNIAAIPDLQAALIEASAVGLPTSLRNEGDRLLDRLSEVERCQKELQICFENNGYRQLEDIAEEYNRLSLLLDDARKLHLSSPQLQFVEDKRKVLESRASAMLKLREAIKIGSEPFIRSAMTEVESLFELHGKFCSRDIVLAQEKLRFILEDIQFLLKMISTIKAANYNLRQSTPQKVEGVLQSSALSDIFSGLESSFHDVMSVWLIRHPSSPTVSLAFEAIGSLLSLIMAWQQKQWSAIPSLVNDINKLVERFSESVIEQGEVLKSCAGELKCEVEILHTIFEADLNENYVAPKLIELLHDRIFTQSDASNELQLLSSLKCLGSSASFIVSHVSEFHELMIKFRSDRYEDVMLSAEEPNIKEARRSLDRSWLFELMALEEVDYEMVKAYNESLECRDMNSRSFDWQCSNAKSHVPECFLSIVDAVATYVKELLVEVMYRLFINRMYWAIECIEKSIQPCSAQAIELTLLHTHQLMDLYNLSIKEGKEGPCEDLYCAPLQYCFSKVSELTRSYTQLCELKMQQKWADIVAHWRMDIIALLSNETLLWIAETSEGTDSRLKFHLLIKNSQRIVFEAADRWVEKMLIDGIRASPFKLELHTFDINSIATDRNLAETIRSARELLEQSKVLSNDARQETYQLLEIFEALAVARTTLWDSNISAVHESLANLQTLHPIMINHSAISVILDELLSEISTMNLAIHLLDSMEEMRILMQRGTTKRYLMPLINGPSDINIPPLSPPSHSPKSNSFSSISGLASSLSIVDLLRADGFTLREEVLDTYELRACYEEEEDWLKYGLEHDSYIIPRKFSEYMNALKSIIDMREMIGKQDWNGAYNIMQSLMQEKSKPVSNLVADELTCNYGDICNYALISTCINALQIGHAQGPIGLVDYRTVSVLKLEDAVNFCQTIERGNPRACAIYDAVLLITDLRKAQKLGDFNEITSILQLAKDRGIGQGHSAICAAEISKAAIEKDNFERSSALKLALMNEEMFTKDGLLVVEQINFQCLNAAMNEAFKLTNENRGSVLNGLLSLAKVVLKAREAARSALWDSLAVLVVEYKAEVEVFLDTLEQRNHIPSLLDSKTMSFRGVNNVRRGTTFSMNKDKDLLKIKSSVLSKETSGKLSLGEEFAELVQAVKRECRAIEHHINVQNIHVQLLEVLSTKGAAVDEAGDFQISGIAVKSLEEVLDRAEKLEKSALSLPRFLKSWRRLGQILLEVRQAVLQDSWDNIEISINDGLKACQDWPELQPCSVELHATSREMDNQWVVSNISMALCSDTTNAKDYEVKLRGVLDHAVQHNPHSDLALRMLYTGESIYKLRCILKTSGLSELQEGIELAKVVLCQIQGARAHAKLPSNLKPGLEIAEDTVITYLLQRSLFRGAISGCAGSLNFKTMDTNLIGQCYELAAHTRLTSELSKAYLQTCRLLQRLRTASQRAYVTRGDNHWKTVESLLREIMETKSSSDVARQTWLDCEVEVDLIAHHAHIELVRAALISTAIRGSHIYFERHNLNIANDLEVVVQNDQFASLIDDLEKIIELIENANLWSDALVNYDECAKALLICRRLILERNWELLSETVRDQTLRSKLGRIEQIGREFGWVLCELHNNNAISVLKNALLVNANSPLEDSLNSTLQSLRGKGFHAVANQLRFAIIQAKEWKITSTLAMSWLECAEQMYALQSSIIAQDHATTAQTLRWFKHHANMLPSYIKLEAQRAYELHQNDLLAQGIKKALQQGQPRGKCGDIDLESIETRMLSNLLKQAEIVTVKCPEVEELLKAATLALKIRLAIKEKDYISLQDAMDQILDNEETWLLIAEDIACARGELDDQVTVSALTEALKTFENLEENVLQLSFLKDSSEVHPIKASSDNKRLSKRLSPINRSYNASVLSNLAAYQNPQRVYSFANKNSPHIDPATIDIQALDQGLRIARDHGVISERSRCLYRTVELIKSLRLAMKNGEWLHVEEILSRRTLDIDPLATKELQLVRTQLSIRAAIVDLSKALKTGWAKCAHGLVDISGMNNSKLSDAIDRAERCFMDLTKQTITSPREESIASGTVPSNNTGRRITFKIEVESHIPTIEESTVDVPQDSINYQIQLLMESARLVRQIRDVITSRQMEIAGELAINALTQPLHYSVLDELRLYGKEIGSSLFSMSQVEELRSCASDGRIYPLVKRLCTLLSADWLNSCFDLGLVRIIDMTTKRCQVLLMLRNQLLSVRQQFDLAAFKHIIQLAQRLNFQDEDLKQTQVLYKHYSMLERLANHFNLLSLFCCNYKAICKKLYDHVSTKSHPFSKRLAFFQRLSDRTMKTLRVHMAVKRGLVYPINTESIISKRSYLSMTSSIQRYRLENFSRLRPVLEYANRMTIVSDELRRSMLCFSDQPLPTSLTQLPVVLAALSVFIFIDCVRALERNALTYPEIALKQLIMLGRQCPPLRDEILLQIIKQTREQPDLVASERLWRVLIACLYHFPPSRKFENYLESYLWHRIIYDESELDRQFAPVAIRCLHFAIYSYGQDCRIKSTVTTRKSSSDNSILDSGHDLDYYTSWISPESLQNIPFQHQRCQVFADFLSSYQSYLDEVVCLDSTAAEHDAILEGDLDRSDPAFINLPPSKAKAKVSASDQTRPTRLSPHALPQHNSSPTGLHFKANPSTTSPTSALKEQEKMASTIILDQNMHWHYERVRGNREDWQQRFLAFKRCDQFISLDLMFQTNTTEASFCPLFMESDADDRFLIRKSQFVASCMTIWSHDLQCDSFDRDLIFFLLLHKPIADARQVLREYRSDRNLFHFLSDDEMKCSRSRQHWLRDHLQLQRHDLQSDFYCSQLHVSEIKHHAEMFWDQIIVVMSRECLQYPFLTWQSKPSMPFNVQPFSSHDSPSNEGPISHDVSEREETMNWEIYRELLLVAMYRCLQFSSQS